MMGNVTTGKVAKFLLVVSACGLLGALIWKVACNPDDIVPGMIYSIFLACWLSGPPALATWLVGRSVSNFSSWFYLAAEVAVIGWTGVLMVRMLALPDAQDGIALMFLPLMQYAGLMAFVFVIGVPQR